MRFRLTTAYLEAVQCRPYIDGVQEGKEIRELLHQFDLFVERVTKTKISSTPQVLNVRADH